MTLKQRLHSGDAFEIGMLSVGMDTDAIQAHLDGNPWDLAFVDLQHTPHTEPQVVTFCQNAEKAGIPVMFRIPHPNAAWQASRYLDFGAAAVLVPMVASADTVREAVDSVYYPPIGKRSCGLTHARGWQGKRDPWDYAQWWNDQAILAIQIETVEAVEGVRELVIPGVDLVLFGATDLGFSLKSAQDSPFSSIAACQHHVVEQLEGVDVRVGVADLPFGRFEAVDGV